MKEKIIEFLNDCISSGACVSGHFDLDHDAIIEIEDILNRYNDTTARSKIRKLLKSNILKL